MKFSPEFIEGGRIVRAARAPSGDGLIYSASGDRWLGVGASADNLVADMIAQIKVREDQSRAAEDFAAWRDWLRG